MMQSKFLSVLFIMSVVVLVSGAIQNNAIAYPQQKQGYFHHGKMVMQPGLYAFGAIASLQNDENGNPTWIVSGLWKGSISLDNETQGNQSATANATAAADSLPNATFHSKFSMVMTNGSSMHNHEIYNFKLTSMSNPNNTTSIFNGTATITLKDGPVDNVPVGIKRIDNNVVSIWADPTMVNNHFGNTPIFGTIEKLLKVEK
jgi:phosphate-selective porin